MASVAAAINRASSSKVDAALWWSPHGALLARLEAIDSGETDSAAGDDGGGDGGRDLVRSLSEHHTWLLHGLARFKPPSSRSRDAIGAARLEVGVGATAGAEQVTIPVVGRLREAAVAASAVLGLDEMQAYFLVDRAAGGERAVVGEAEGEGEGKGAGLGVEKRGRLEGKAAQQRLVQEAAALYREERQNLLKCVRLLLVMQADASSPHASAIEGEVRALLDEGLLSNAMAQLRALPRFEPPKALDRAGVAEWAEASSLEACLLLDILILIASSNGCSAAVVLDIVTLVQELFFGFPPSAPLSPAPYSISPSSSSSSSSSSASLASLAISAASESLLSTALHRAVLLLIAAVNVEGAVVALAQGEKFSASSHPLSSPSALTDVDQRLSAWLSCILSAAAARGGGAGEIGLAGVMPVVGTGSSAAAGAGLDVSPVLLAWGLFRLLLQWLPDSSQLPSPALNPSVCVQAAYSAGALDRILSSLLSSSLPPTPPTTLEALGYMPSFWRSSAVPSQSSFEFLESTMGAALLLPLPPAYAALSSFSAPQALPVPRSGGLLVPLSALLILFFRLVHLAQQQDASSATWQTAIGSADVSTSAGLGGEEAAEELAACVRALLHLHSSPLVAAATANGLLPHGMTVDPTALITAILDGLLSSPALSSASSSSSSPSPPIAHTPSAAATLTAAACCLRMLAAFALLPSIAHPLPVRRT
ncbi:hypothetical protein CLOP_g8759 [Closterium sp. NIES-67]|nr:hypothetical protein CLOP_g8759 [Closterium sp. NIES-67]